MSYARANLVTAPGFAYAERNLLPFENELGGHGPGDSQPSTVLGGHGAVVEETGEYDAPPPLQPRAPVKKPKKRRRSRQHRHAK